MKAPFNSEWQASAGIQYAASLGSSGTLTPRLDWSYQSSFYYNAVNTPFDLVAGRSTDRRGAALNFSPASDKVRAKYERLPVVARE